MKDNVVKMALYSDDNMKWTPKDCLEELLNEIHKGLKVTRLAIHYIREDEEGNEIICFIQAKMTRDLHLAMLSGAMYKINRDRYGD
jgi:cytochrome c2